MCNSTPYMLEFHIFCTKPSVCYVLLILFPAWLAGYSSIVSRHSFLSCWTNFSLQPRTWGKSLYSHFSMKRVSYQSPSSIYFRARSQLMKEAITCNVFSHWLSPCTAIDGKHAQYRKSHCGVKGIVRSSFFYSGNLCTDETASLYWTGTHFTTIFHLLLLKPPV